MKFSTITISALSIIASATQVNARRRHLNTIKGDESDASMSYMLSPARGSSKSKSATGAPTGSPTGAPTSAPIPEPGECNSIINTGNNGNGNVFTLQKSLLCDCSEDPALTVGGQGIVLKLNGYTVECTVGGGDEKSNVIKILETANTVMGPGTVTVVGPDGANFATSGIALFGGGFHTVDGVTIGPVGEGIEIFSNDNTIINNFITADEFDGVVIFGRDRNIIKGNKIVNGRIRLDLSSTFGTADDNQVLDNTIISSGLEGIVVVGKRVVIQGNTIDQSGGNGIEVSSFTSSKGTPFISEGVNIKGNSITNSGEFGIEIESGSLNTVVIGNTLAGNGGDNLLNNGTDTVFAGNVPNLM